MRQILYDATRMCCNEYQMKNRVHNLIRKAPANYNKAFTLIELLVVVGIISLLVSILLPSLQKAKELARLAVCQSNVHNISLKIMMYVSEDPSGMFPLLCTKATDGSYCFWENRLGLTSWWARAIPPYGIDYPCCPSIPEGIYNGVAYGGFSYAMNPQLGYSLRIHDVEIPSETLVIGDNLFSDSLIGDWHLFYRPSYPGFHQRDDRHDETINVMWADGHIESEDIMLLSEGLGNDENYYWWYNKQQKK